jgi:putative methyltransferase (TIGR04325 family)
MLAEWEPLAAAARSTGPIVAPASEAAGPEAQDIVRHDTYMTLAYVVGLAGWSRESISMLDWGCGLGSYALIARALHPNLRVEYFGRELPILTTAARKVLPQDRFWDTADEAFDRTYDLVVASGSLQYSHEWRQLLERLSDGTDRYLYLTRTPVVTRADSFVVVQRPIARYGTRYPGWVLNRKHLVDVAEARGLRLLREFLIGDFVSIPGVPERPDFRGFLFQRTTGA